MTGKTETNSTEGAHSVDKGTPCTYVLGGGEPKKGTFHRFADGYYLDEGNNRVPQTFAVVESDTGALQLLDIDWVKLSR